MKKVVFMNFSPDKSGNILRIGKRLLKDSDYAILQMSDFKIRQYGQVFDDNQISAVFQKIKDKDIILTGTPVYWYTVSGILKTFIDRIYLLKEKERYFFAQGSAPDQNTVERIGNLANRFSQMRRKAIKSVIVDFSQGHKIISGMSIHCSV